MGFIAKNNVAVALTVSYANQFASLIQHRLPSVGVSIYKPIEGTIRSFDLYYGVRVGELLKLLKLGLKTI